MKKKSNRRTRYFLLILACLTLLGLLIRLLVSWQLIGNDPFAYDPPSVTDMATYLQQSREILQGNFPEVFYYQPFYYSVFLPLCKWIFRADIWAVAAGQSFCSAGIIWLCGICAALLRGRRCGIFAAVLACFSAMLIFYVPYALIEIQQAFWFTLLFYLTLQGYRKNLFRYWAGAGIILSFAVLSRGNAWCFLPCLAAAVFFAGKKQASPVKCQLFFLLILLFFSLIPQLPFIITNSLATGTLTGPSTAGPTVLALGNNPEAPAGHLVYPETYRRWFETAHVRPVVDSIADWAMEEPAAFLELQFRKFLLYWDAGEIPNNVSWEQNGKKSSVLMLTGKVSGAVILFLALGACFMLFRSGRYHKGVLLLMGFCSFYALAAAAFYILARFRVPSLGLLIMLAAFLPDLLWRRCKKRPVTWSSWTGPAAACA